MIKVKQLYKKYTSKNGEIITALNNINLEFEDNGLVFILGKSGCGKTTLLNILGGIDTADAGSIEVDFISDTNIVMKDILQLSEQEMDIYHNIYLGFVFQNHYLIDNWNIKENIAITLQQQAEENPQYTIDEKIENVLKYIGLQNIELRKPNELSGGQSQRIAIARALAKKPKVILADEPTGNLDSKSSEKIFALLKDISKNCLVVVVTHDEQSALEYGDRIIKLKDGNIIDDINNQSEHFEYNMAIKDVQTNSEESIETKSLEKLKDFICTKIISDKNNKDFFVNVKFNKTTNNNISNSERKTNIKIKNISKKTIFMFAINNLKIRKVRLAITVLIFTLTLMFLQVIGELCISNSNKSVCEYLVNNNVNKIYLGTDISYRSDFYDEYIVNRADTKEIKNLINKYWEQKNCYSNISEAILSSTDYEIIALINANTDKIVLLSGNEPINANDICITDYCAKQLGFSNNCIGEKIYIYDVEFTVSGVIDTNYEEQGILMKRSTNRMTPYDDYLVKKRYSRCACSKDFAKYLYEKSEYISIKASNFFIESDENYINSSINYSGIKNIKDSALIKYGRIPQNKYEVLVSYDFAVNNYLIDNNEFIEKHFYYLDIYDTKYNGAYYGKINMYDILGEITIVGIVETNGISPVDVWVNDEVYDELKKEYFYNQVYDSFELLLSGLSYNDLKKCVTEMQTKNIDIQEPNIEQIYEVYERKDNILIIGMILVAVFLLLTILLNVSFISYSVSDNHSKIGILRALGVKKKNISMIFLYEALFVSVVSFIFSYIISMFVFLKINSLLEKFTDCKIIFFYRNYAVVLGVLAISIILGLICVILPVLSMSKEKPINLIKNTF